MRLALALEYPLMQSGGTEVLVRELLRGLAARHEIVLVSGDRDRNVLPAEMSALIVTHLSWQPGGAAAAKSLAHALRALGVQLAHFHFGGTYEWQSRRFWRCPIHYLARLGVLCLATNHLAVEWLNCGCDPGEPPWRKFIFQIFAWLSRAVIYQRLAIEVAVSQHDRARLTGQFPIFGKRIIQRYHSLLSADAAPPAPERKKIILNVGHLAFRKGQHLLAAAFARLAPRHPQWELHLAGSVGEAACAQEIEATARTAGVRARVHLLGRRNDAGALMSAAAIYVQPSLEEGLGLALQEALHAGCACVGARTGGIPELIRDEDNGLLFARGDVAALAAALERLIADEPLRARLSARAPASLRDRRMTASEMVAEYDTLYRSLLDSKK